jgi:hypothetical protein
MLRIFAVILRTYRPKKERFMKIDALDPLTLGAAEG